jgi:membrane-associated phospholipid phosphatase
MPVTESPGNLGVKYSDRSITRFVQRIYYDYSTQLQFPFRYLKRNPKGFVLGTTGILTLIFTDHLTHDVLTPDEDLEESRLRDYGERLSRLGDTETAYPVVLGFAALGLLTKSRRELDTGMMLFEALLTSATWTYLLKITTGRERPREVDGTVADWSGPGGIFGDDDSEGDKPRAFPSGHSTGIWALATILSHQYPQRRVVPILAYTTAMAMSYARMVVGAHWLSDVVVGGLIGYGSAKQVLAAHEEPQPPSEASQLRFGMDVGGQYTGIHFRYNF